MRNLYRSRISAVLLACVMLSGPFARAQFFSSRLFDEEKGLEQKFIFSIAQAQNGVIQLATERGVVNFNGERFISYTKLNGLPEDQAASIFSDSRGITWVGHFQRGISCISKGVVTVIDSQLVKGRVNYLAEDPKGNIWGVSDGQGIFSVDFATGKVSFPTGGDFSAGPILFDQSGVLLVGRDDGLGVYTAEKGSIALQKVLPETQGKKVDAVCFGKMNGQTLLFVAVDGDGVYCYNQVQNDYHLLLALKNELRCNDKIFSALACGFANELWIGTVGEGLRKVTFSLTFVPEQTELFMQSNGLPDDNIKSLLVDHENNLWVGTFGHGLLQLPYTVFHFYTQTNGLIRSEVNCIARDRQGTFWLGNNNGITHYWKDGLLPAHFFDAKNGFASSRVTCMVEDSAGKIWIGTAGDGIFRLDPQSERFEAVSTRYHLTSKIINTITIDASHSVLFGTTDGLYVYQPKEDKFAYYTTVDGLLHNNIQQLYTDLDDNVWFSSAGTPPYMMKDGEISAFKEISKLKGANINGVCEDKSKLIWVATDGDGVFSFDGQSFKKYGIEKGLRSATCIAVISDNDGLVWVVHKSGLSLKFPDDSVFYSFADSDNKLFSDMNSFVYKDPSGVIYLCSSEGFVEISGRDKSFIRRGPEISLAALFVNGNEYAFNDELDLPPGTYNLSFEFNNILYRLPNPPPFFYRIGADTVWRPAEGRTITIPQLSPGEYTLQVASSIPDKKTARIPIAIKIFIDKPFWQKTWFIVLVFTTVPLVVLLLVYLQTLSLRKMNQRLQVLVQRKTKMLEEEKEYVSKINLELENKNKDITDSILYAKRIQLAVLPDSAILKNQFPDSFIFYLPRDIVSGDFYWFTQKGPTFIIAAVDCTGHGIPGAFMSMIGTTLLNKIVFDYNVTEPAEILQHLNKEITSSLHQQDSSESTHDGMDIALCTINKATGALTFSGAGRPLYVVRNQEVTEYKTYKAGIGGVYRDVFPQYGGVTVQLQPGDAIYLSSDGYADQFGSASHTKFSSKRFRALLKQISDFPMEEQLGMILESYLAWKGDEGQVDDILVLGFKYCTGDLAGEIGAGKSEVVQAVEVEA